MVNYKLTNRAVSDLKEIWNYTKNKWSENQAEIYFNQLIETCSFLAQNQSSGKTYFEVKNNLLGFRSGKHIIFYEKLPSSKILIIRILHERMNLEERLIE